MALSNTEAIFNSLYGLFSLLAIIVAVVFFAVMGYFLMKYRARPKLQEPHDTPTLDRVPPHRGHLKTVVILLLLSSIILGFLIAGTFTQVDVLLNVPAECQPPAGGANPCFFVNVTAHQFYFQITYPGNLSRSDVNLIRVPVNRTTVLRVTSMDVFHNFGIREFKIKTDAIPGRTNMIWFKAFATGNYTIQCFELCGAGHTGMIGTLIVMPQPLFQKWYGS
jgi:cytochrome c oxidase subunit II